MGTALSIVILFTISSTIVRVMSVVLEHTGVPQSIARIQVLSAFSGTGFTTVESEMLLQTPERRSILKIIMIAGSIGLASISATVIVGALGVADTASGIIQQLLFILISLIFVRYVIFAGAVDSLVCGLAFKWLRRYGYEVRSYTLLHRLGSKTLIAEHWIKENTLLDETKLASEGLQILGQHNQDNVEKIENGKLKEGTTILLVGSREAHDQFSSEYGSLDTRGEH